MAAGKRYDIHAEHHVRNIYLCFSGRSWFKISAFNISPIQAGGSFGDRCIIDFTLRNCLRSNLLNPRIITQYESAHLTRHVRRWSLDQSAFAVDASPSPVCVPAPKSAYSGTADALFRNIRILNSDTEHVIVLSADHVYDMDYRELLQFHLQCDADATR